MKIGRTPANATWIAPTHTLTFSSGASAWADESEACATDGPAIEMWWDDGNREEDWH